MKYEELIETIYEIVNNEKIYKKGLNLVYYLDEINHKKMDEHLFFKTNNEEIEFKHNDIIEITLEGITIKILKNL